MLGVSSFIKEIVEESLSNRVGVCFVDGDGKIKDIAGMSDDEIKDLVHDRVKGFCDVVEKGDYYGGYILTEGRLGSLLEGTSEQYGKAEKMYKTIRNLASPFSNRTVEFRYVMVGRKLGNYIRERAKDYHRFERYYGDAKSYADHTGEYEDY